MQCSVETTLSTLASITLSPRWNLIPFLSDGTSLAVESTPVIKPFDDTDTSVLPSVGSDEIVSLCGGIFGLAYGIYNLVMELYPVIILLSAGESDLVTNLLPIIFVSLSAIVEMIIVPLVIIFYPFVLEKERYY